MFYSAPIIDFSSQISGKLGPRIASGYFGDVYRCTVESREGRTEVAVKVFRNDPMRTTEKIEKAICRELKVWLRLEHSTIVPLLGFASESIEPPFPALVSQWMPSGTLYTYLKDRAHTLDASAKFEFAERIADGLNYLHSNSVVHGDLHPGNVLIDDLGNPRLTDFGLATVVGDVELQLSTATAERSFNSRFRAPEIIGIECDLSGRPTFKSDIYSFGGMMFFVFSGDMPWKEKNSYQVTVELLKRATPARPDKILDGHWDLIRECWSWDPCHRPWAAEALERIITVQTADNISRNCPRPKVTTPVQSTAHRLYSIVRSITTYIRRYPIGDEDIWHTAPSSRGVSTVSPTTQDAVPVSMFSDKPPHETDEVRRARARDRFKSAVSTVMLLQSYTGSLGSPSVIGNVADETPYETDVVKRARARDRFSSVVQTVMLLQSQVHTLCRKMSVYPP
ncbi:hypothetical protein AZE42_07449 [Rhizopogon vesiculosus]|uniref:Protein kinase domain-containing protein n=1 Tax=Rhizopogon vesiculosus TaxID=180088 RepID=A0A1J8R1C9_9AGAM|nr:hypothetical protein AZE42_07449 [Rhizopogon vesiculosus]